LWKNKKESIQKGGGGAAPCRNTYLSTGSLVPEVLEEGKLKKEEKTNVVHVGNLKAFAENDGAS